VTIATARIRMLRAALLGPLLVLLSACWVSQFPFVDATNSTEVGFAGTYRNGDNEPLFIIANGDGSYLMGDNHEQLRTLFLDYGKGWYIAQYEVRDDDVTATLEQKATVYVYQLVSVAPGQVTLYEPVCDEDLRGIPGLDVSKEGCELETFDALREVVRNVIGRINDGDTDFERGVFTRVNS